MTRGAEVGDAPVAAGPGEVPRGDDDVVLVPGDISWAMRLEDALPDLEDIAALPGEKVLLRGNHDYWWPSITRLRQALPPRMHALQNDALVVRGIVVAGTRGWITPGSHGFTPQDDKIYRREVERLHERERVFRMALWASSQRYWDFHVPSGRLGYLVARTERGASHDFSSQQADPAAAARGFELGEDAGGHQPGHRARQVLVQVEVADLQQ